MRVAKTITIDIKIVSKISIEAIKAGQTFSRMVECILRSYYNEKERSISDHDENRRNLYNEMKSPSK